MTAGPPILMAEFDNRCTVTALTPTDKEWQQQIAVEFGVQMMLNLQLNS